VRQPRHRPGYGRTVPLDKPSAAIADGSRSASEAERIFAFGQNDVFRRQLAGAVARGDLQQFRMVFGDRSVERNVVVVSSRSNPEIEAGRRFHVSIPDDRPAAEFPVQPVIEPVGNAAPFNDDPVIFGQLIPFEINGVNRVARSDGAVRFKIAIKEAQR